ncbi:DUF932 domain-containing protein [Paraburkholderia sp. J8-2]|uniref:DUF932 domain-containing protein n=1 Tax=Paraburkholderia sp. J8-2 TaxID=2805440 RepID=UPI002AB667CB|nr:DUF932 domain-containing protein [Paraburkholderia sp. J8-2]
MHQLTINDLGRAEMAWAGMQPWHGLGQKVRSGASLEEWQHLAGLNWEVLRRPVRFETEPESSASSLRKLDGHFVLMRSDTHAGLSVVSKRYRVVQPKQVLEFFRSLVKGAGFEIETAGSLSGGKTVWVLANTGLANDIVNGDRLLAYLLLATSYDGSMATTATFTSTRVVCNNTLRIALSRDASSQVRIRHDEEFDPDVVKSDLGLMADESWTRFVSRMKSLSAVQMSGVEAGAALAGVLSARQPKGSDVDVTESKGYRKILELFGGSGRGSNLAGVRNTAWGLVNAVTQFVDFERTAQSPEKRLIGAWFGDGARLKDEIVSELLTLV